MFEKIVGQELRRELKTIKTKGVILEHDGHSYLNLSSNDYLGISDHTDWQCEFLSEVGDAEDFLMSSCSSRLLTGNDSSYDCLETEIARSYKKESCLVFGSGYHANLGILPALTRKDDLILADKLVHASLIDGLRLCRCKWFRYRHNDFDDLERLLRNEKNKYRNVFIVTESIFSMEGDCADLVRIAAIKKKYGAFLYLDEAHAIGVRGERGFGLVEESGVLDEIDILVGTFGKALASQGAFVVGDKSVRDALINSARTLIFTTALPPIVNRWTFFVWKKMLGMQGQRNHLRLMTDLFRNNLKNNKLLGDSHIVPLLVEGNQQCLEIAEKIRQRGLWASAIRHPTVPLDQPRLRFSLTAAFTEEHIHKINEILLETT